MHRWVDLVEAENLALDATEELRSGDIRSAHQEPVSRKRGFGGEVTLRLHVHSRYTLCLAWSVSDSARDFAAEHDPIK